MKKAIAALAAMAALGAIPATASASAMARTYQCPDDPAMSSYYQYLTIQSPKPTIGEQHQPGQWFHLSPCVVASDVAMWGTYQAPWNLPSRIYVSTNGRYSGIQAGWWHYSASWGSDGQLFWPLVTATQGRLKVQFTDFVTS
jgi:hypothetical protein